MKFKQCLICIISLFVLLITPFSSYGANIEWVDGEDDCDHEYEIVAFDSITSEATLQCVYCYDTYTEQIDSIIYSLTNSEVDSSTCNHSYKIIAFDRYEACAVVVCTTCGDSFQDYFAPHVYDGVDNSNYVSWYDVVEDGYVNGKDFSFLFNQYSGVSDDDSNYNLIDFMSDSHFYYKEIFFFCYITILLIILTTVTILILRRSS